MSALSGTPCAPWFPASAVVHVLVFVSRALLDWLGNPTSGPGVPTVLCLGPVENSEHHCHSAVLMLPPRHQCASQRDVGPYGLSFRTRVYLNSAGVARLLIVTRGSFVNWCRSWRWRSWRCASGCAAWTLDGQTDRQTDRTGRDRTGQDCQSVRVCLYVCLSVCLSGCLSVCLSVSLRRVMV